MIAEVIRKENEKKSGDNVRISTEDRNLTEAFEKNIEVGDIIKRVGTQQVSSLTEFKKKVKASEKKGTLLLLIKKPKGTSQFITLNF